MSDRVTVILDGSQLSGVGASSGIGTYIRNLVAGLSDRSDVRPVVMCEREVNLPPGSQSLPIRRRARRPRAQVIEHAVRLPVELRTRGRDGAVFHNPSYHAPFGIRPPWIQSLHDVIPLVISAPDQAALRARWKRFGPRYRHADAVIAVSRYTATEGTRILGLDPARVHVVPHGVDPTYRPAPDEPDPQGRPYVLLVAQYSQRKGFPEAFALLDNLADAGYPHRLIVAGPVHPWNADELSRLHAAARHPDRIELKGYVDDLPRLYRHAQVFVMPSRYEGFGLPCLEAMACGTPVVSFDNTSLTEVVTAGGRLVPDGDVDALTTAVRDLLDSDAARTELGRQGLEHAAGYTWAASAAGHAEVYASVGRN